MMNNEHAYQFTVDNIFPVDAQTAGEALEAIYSKYGAITPENVLNDSREEGTPLHKCFEWDDKIASEKYRLSQAGKIIRAVVIVHKTPHEDREPVRYYVHCRAAHEYHPMNIVLENKDMRAEMLENAKRDFENFRRKYSVLTSLTGFFAAADEAWPK